MEQLTPPFERFAAQILPRLMRFADVLTGQHQLAEDIVQDVLIRTQQRWERIGSLDAPEAYLRRMIVNDFVSWRRRLARATPTVVLEDLDVVTDGADFATDHAQRDELAARLRTLPPKQRAAIVLRFYVGVPDSEIAAALGCSEGTVRSHISRALTTLRVVAAEPTFSHRSL